MGAILAGIGAATTATVAFGASAVNTGKDFDAAMSQISATMGMTSDDIANNVEVTIGGAVVNAGDTFDALREEAMQMGAETNFSATQAAEGLNILAMSGFDAGSSMEMIEDVLHLAAAGGMEMADSAAYIAGSMKGFNDETKDSAYYADLMAKGATLANTSVAQLGEAMSGGAATAAAYSQDADSMTISLLRLAEQGEVGSAASTALAAAMKNLFTPTDQAAAALEELGVAAYDSEGNARDFNNVVDELNAALSTMSDEEANAYKQTIFGIQGLDAFNKMTVTSVEKQEEWAAALAASSGEAAKQYDTMTDNLEGDIAIWNSALDGFKIALSDKLTPAIRDFVQFGSDSLGKLTEALESGDYEAVAEAAGEIVVELLNRLTEMLPDLIEMGATILTTLIDGIAESLPQIMDAATQILMTLVDAILENLPTLLEVALQMIVTLATGIAQHLPELIPAIVDVVLQIVNVLIENLPLLIEAALLLFMGIVEGLIQALPQIIAALPTLIDSIVAALIDAIPLLIDCGVQLFVALIANLPEIIVAIVKACPEIVKSLVRGFLELATQIKDTGRKLMEKLKEGISSMLSNLVNTAKDLGKNIVNGIWNGISAGWNWLTEKVGSLASGLFDAAKSALGISSPSKKFRWLAEMCVAGFDDGMEDLMNGDAFGAMVNNTLGTVATNLRGSGGGGPNGQTFNFYDTQTSPDAIRRKVQNTMTFGLAGGI